MITPYAARLLISLCAACCWCRPPFAGFARNGADLRVTSPRWAKIRVPGEIAYREHETGEAGVQLRKHPRLSCYEESSLIDIPPAKPPRLTVPSGRVW